MSSSELLEMRKLVRSPFYNKRADVIALFDYLNICLKKGKKPTKKLAFETVSRSDIGREYDDHAIRLPMSILKKLIERYFVQKEVFSEPSFVASKLAAVLRKRKLSKQHEKIVRDSSKQLESQPLRNTKILEHQLDFQLEEYQRIISTKRTRDLNLQQLSDQLDNIFIAKKLKQVCLLLSHQRVYKKDYDFGLLDALVEKVESKNLFEIPAIGIYYFAWKTLSTEEEDYFQEFKKMVLEQSELFPKDEMRDLTILAINFCIQKYNQGNQKYLQEEFEIYEEGLVKGYFLNDNLISRFTYRNIVTLGLVLRKYDWTEQFILDYKTKLDKEFRDNTFNFNLARLEYERKNYEYALELLRQCIHGDLLLELSTRTMFLKIFYELEDFDLSSFHLSSFQIFLRRKKIISYHKKLYSNFLKVYQKLINLPSGNKKGKQKLLEQIESIEQLAERKWLVSQLS